MADLVIEMYQGAVEKSGEDIQVPAGHLGNLVIADIGATSKRTAADFASGTRLIRISTDEAVDVYYNLGDDTVAATKDCTEGSRPLRTSYGWLDLAIDEHTRISVIK